MSLHTPMDVCLSIGQPYSTQPKARILIDQLNFQRTVRCRQNDISIRHQQTFSLDTYYKFTSTSLLSTTARIHIVASCGLLSLVLRVGVQCTKQDIIHTSFVTYIPTIPQRAYRASPEIKQNLMRPYMSWAWGIISNLTKTSSTLLVIIIVS